ncbi:MAG TPA: DUF4129 domain-containing protein [Gillisia sp.]|nr:DUF4129 domain-containing protein [Gillisia sp.]
MKLFLIILSFICCNYSLFAYQDSIASSPSIQYETGRDLNPVSFNSEKLEGYKQQKDFDYLKEVENDSWWSRFKKWLDMKYHQFMEWLFGEYTANSILLFILMILPYLILAAILGLIVWLFIRLNPGASLLGDPQEPQVYFNEEEEIIQNADISGLIEEAIANKDYRLAIRYYYLRLLKNLDKQGIIKYEYQKTNAEYLAEIKEQDLQHSVKRIIRLYNFIWYGSFPVTGEDFNTVRESFRSIETNLKPAGNE